MSDKEGSSLLDASGAEMHKPNLNSMTDFRETEVVKPFHLTLEEYQQIFNKIKPRKESSAVALVCLCALNNLNLETNTNKEKQQQENALAMLSQGYMAVWKGNSERCEDIELGKLYGTGPHAHSRPLYAKTVKIIVKDVFPRVREYFYLIVDQMDVNMEIDDSHLGGDLHVVVQKVNHAIERRLYDEHMAELEAKDLDVNKFKEDAITLDSQ